MTGSSPQTDNAGRAMIRHRTGVSRLTTIATATLACFALALVVAAAPAAAVVFSNTGAITMPDPNCTDPDIASPYPSNIVVSGLTGTITDVNVTLTGITHPFEGNIEVLLVGPSGGSQKHHPGIPKRGTGSLSSATVTFDDSAAAQAPQDGVHIAIGRLSRP